MRALILLHCSVLLLPACNQAPSIPSLSVDAGLVGDAAARPLALVGDRVSDRLQLYSLGPSLEEAAELSVDENPGFIDEPFDLALGPSGDVAYLVLGHGAGYQMGTLSKIRLADGVVLGSVVLGEEPSMIALASDGRRAYVSLFRNLAHPHGPWTDPGALVVVDTDKMQVLGQVELCAAPLGVALDEERARVWVACLGAPDDKALALVDVSGAPRVLQTLSVADAGGPGQGAAYLVLDGAHAFLTAQGSGDLFVWDRETLALERRISFGSSSFPQRMALAGAGAFLLVSVDGSSQIAVVSTSALLVQERIATPGMHPQGIAVLPGGASAVFTDEGDLVHAGRLVRLDLTGLGAGGARIVDTAPTLVFPQAVIILP